MKVLLTIEEYKERAINNIIEIANSCIVPTADDFFKWEFIHMLAQKSFENHFMLCEFSNRMWINVFDKDRNGKRLNSSNIRKIDKEEAEEFNRQDFYAHLKPRYCCSSKLAPYKNLGKDVFTQQYNIHYLITLPFENVDNISYEIANICFKRLYGYEYEVDTNFVCK